MFVIISRATRIDFPDKEVKTGAGLAHPKKTHKVYGAGELVSLEGQELAQALDKGATPSLHQPGDKGWPDFVKRHAAELRSTRAQPAAAETTT